ncbi:DNA-binding transcriptional MerR regulator [Arthrobacter sp. CAN_A214]|uniref:heavy metal-responsive transcriptional regulator n=1 Tax=Arthrobacter sp. CAN_A214 TaxID=2787720 RepID=UPI0018C99040
MRIGELANATGTTTKTLRFYESAGLMPIPPRTSSGYRDYPSDTVHRIAFIRRGQSAGLTLAQIGEILHIRDGGNAPCAHVKSLLSERLKELDHQIADLLALRETVQSLHSASLTIEPAACAPNQVCQYI